MQLSIFDIETTADPAPQRKKRKYTPRKNFPRSCIECGDEFLTNAANAKFCGTPCKGRAGYRRNRDKRLKAAREYRHANRDITSAQKRKYYWENRELLLQQNRLYYQKNREAIIASASAYQAANPEVVALTRSRRRAAEAFKITRRDHRRLIARFNNSCAYCGVELAEWGRSRPNSLQWDHVLPISKGGRDSVGNILPVCRSCNIGKHGSFLFEWKVRKRNMDKLNAKANLNE